MSRLFRRMLAGKRRYRRLSVAKLVALMTTPAVWSAPVVASAQRSVPAEPPQAKSGAGQAPVSPPVLLENAEPIYPPTARAEGLEGTVVLRLKIDIDGNVQDAVVIVSADHGFDEASLEAAKRLRFEPSRRGDQPVAALISFTFEFKPASAVPAEPPALAEAVPATPEAAIGLPEPVETVTQPAAAADSPVEVLVVGARTEGQRLQESAEAVNVVDTRKAQRQTADLGELLARTQGVTLRRDGGLGSSTRFSLNGLYDDQIRFFVDGIPLDLAGFPFGIANVPVNLVERVEIYRGVVPIRFGADALGGAVNLVSDVNYETHAGVSYQVGSYGTHRIALDARYRHEVTGIVVGAAAFFDAANNNYPVDVDIPNSQGRPYPGTVPRFHDRYRAAGVMLEAGVVDKPWAKRLLLRGFFSGYDKELQHNIVMTVPYGEVSYGERVHGATLRYEVDVHPDVELQLLGSYTQRTIDYSDKSEWVYDWYGRRVYPRKPGEIEARAHDQTLWEDTLFGRGILSWKVARSDTLRVSLSPASSSRTGEERVKRSATARDPLTAQRELFTLVGGIENEFALFGDRLSNITFLKDYYYHARSEEPQSGGIFRRRNTARHRQGLGDSLRYRFLPWLYAKASYEYATRLPRTDEVFGDGMLTFANLELQPEVSHNANLGPRVELTQTGIGDVTVDMNAFLRDSDRLIVLLGSARYYTYQNVYRARGLGLESAITWSSPEHFAALEGTLTWQSVRNASSKGTFGNTEGDRIPNRPYLFASWGGHLRFTGLPSAADSLEPYYSGRYVHGFYRGWESLGLKEYKDTVDPQVAHDIGVSWSVNRSVARITSTLEIDNLTDAKLFDNFGVQRPGRAISVKVTGEL